MHDDKLQAILLGTGILTWPAEERRSDRYGTVALIEETSSDAYLPLNTTPAIGMSGRLLAHVIETRQSSHIGDLFRGVSPSTPELDDWIILGDGTFFVEANRYGQRAGLAPADNRETDWLYIRELYKAHSQTVELYFQPIDA